MLKTILKFNVFNNNLQLVEFDDSYLLNPIQPFRYKFIEGYFFLVPNYMEEIGNA